ncbi:TolC family protein [Calditrichota bacterium GD2]
MKAISAIIVLAVFMLNHNLSGRNIHVLTLEKSQQLARQNSFKMRSLLEDFKIARYELRAARNRFKTQVNLKFDLPDYSETISSLQDSTGLHYFPLKQARYNAYLQIEQPLPTDGFFYLSSGIYHVQDYFLQEQSFRLNTRLGFEQPIETFYAYNRIKSSLKMAELNYRLSEKRLLRAQLDLEYEVASAFYSLYSALERKNIALQTLRQQRDAYQLALNKFKAGVIAEVEALQMEVDLGEAQNNFDLSLVEVQQKADAFKQLLNIDLQDSVILNTDLTYPIVKIDLQKALEFGFKNRLEIQERKIAIEQQKLNLKRIDAENQIRGKISAYYDFIGVRQEPRHYALNTTFQNAWEELKKRPGNRGIAFSITIPLWDWHVNKNQTLAQKARLHQQQMALKDLEITIKRDIRNTVMELESSLKRLQLLEKNVAVAEKSFAISKNRFANGDINSQALALDRNRLSQAYNSRLNALINYKLLLADVKRKTFYDFVNDHPVSLDDYLQQE